MDRQALSVQNSTWDFSFSRTLFSENFLEIKVRLLRKNKIDIESTA